MITIDTINNVVLQCGIKVKMDHIVAGDQSAVAIYGMSHLRYVSERGGHYHFCFMGDGKKIYIKSILKIRNKHKHYTRLINGQADKNCEDVVWFDDCRGPVVFDNTLGWPMIEHINRLLAAKATVFGNDYALQLDMPFERIPMKGDVGEFKMTSLSKNNPNNTYYFTLVANGKNVFLKDVFCYSKNPDKPIEERIKPQYLMQFPEPITLA